MKHFVYLKNRIKQNKTFIVLVIIMGVFYLSFGCPGRFLFGFCCPGCGMSRAVEAALHLDFQLAFQMHPLFFLLPVAATVYLIRKKIPKKVMIVLVISVLILMLAVYIYRLNTGSDTVYIDFKRGILYKVLESYFTEG